MKWKIVSFKSGKWTIKVQEGKISHQPAWLTMKSIGAGTCTCLRVCYSLAEAKKHAESLGALNTWTIHELQTNMWIIRKLINDNWLVKSLNSDVFKKTFPTLIAAKNYAKIYSWRKK